MSNENLALWISVQETDPNHTKPAKIGQMKITAICPQYQRKNATEKFGPYGIGWGIVPNSEKVQGDIIGDTTLATYQATMFYMYEEQRGEFPICSSIKVAFITNGGQGYLKIDDEYMKKLQTDALTKGLSFLGFNADIFEGLFDDNRYVAAMKQKHEQVSNVPIRDKFVERAVEVYLECVEADVEEIDSQKMQDVNALLSNDERIEVMNVLKPLGKMKGTNRAYTTIVNECLKAHVSDNEIVEGK